MKMKSKTIYLYLKKKLEALTTYSMNTRLLKANFVMIKPTSREMTFGGDADICFLSLESGPGVTKYITNLYII